MINVINLIIRIEIYTYIIEKAQRRKILLMKKCFIIGYGIVERKFFDDVVIKKLVEIVDSIAYVYHEIYVDSFGDFEKRIYDKLRDRAKGRKVMPIMVFNNFKSKFNLDKIMNTDNIELTKYLIENSIDAIFLSTEKNRHIVNSMIDFAIDKGVKNYAIDIEALFDIVVF